MKLPMVVSRLRVKEYHWVHWYFTSHLITPTSQRLRLGRDQEFLWDGELTELSSTEKFI
jgi:hypothetical protein